MFREGQLTPGQWGQRRCGKTTPPGGHRALRPELHTLASLWCSYSREQRDLIKNYVNKSFSRWLAKVLPSWAGCLIGGVVSSSRPIGGMEGRMRVGGSLITRQYGEGILLSIRERNTTINMGKEYYRLISLEYWGMSNNSTRKSNISGRIWVYPRSGWLFIQTQLL